MINKLFGMEHDLKDSCDEDRKVDHHERSLSVLAQLKSCSRRSQLGTPWAKPSITWRVTGTN